MEMGIDGITACSSGQWEGQQIGGIEEIKEGATEGEGEGRWGVVRRRPMGRSKIENGERRRRAREIMERACGERRDKGERSADANRRFVIQNGSEIKFQV